MIQQVLLMPRYEASIVILKLSLSFTILHKIVCTLSEPFTRAPFHYLDEKYQR